MKNSKIISDDIILPNMELISENGIDYIRKIARNSEKSYEVLNHQTIDSGGSQREAFDIFYPDKIVNSLPVLIFMHGGYWVNGAREMMAYMAEQIVCSNKPMIFVSVGYRLSPEFKFPRALEDCAAAINKVYAVIENYGGDKNNLIISGHSAGGNLAALFVLNKMFLKNMAEDSIKLCAPLSGVFNLHDMPLHIKSAYIDDEEKYIHASPLHCDLAHNRTPFLLTIGENDFENVKRSHTLMCAKMKYFNNNLQSFIVPNECHLGLSLNAAHENHRWAKLMRTYV